MNAKRYPADSRSGRMLLALRAGPLATDAFYERFPSSQYVRALIKGGLVEQTSGGDYRLTPAGRAACPYRNPLAAPGAPLDPGLRRGDDTGKETDMKLTREAVFKAITEAGPAGIARPALCRRFDCAENAVDFHVGTLYKTGAIVKPKRGLLVAAECPPQAAVPVTPAEAGVQDAPADDLLDFDLEAAQSLDVTAAPATLAPPSLAVRVTAPRGVDQDPYLDDPDAVEFAVFSSGGLDIYHDDAVITLAKPVLAKLRAFLGLFGEVA